MIPVTKYHFCGWIGAVRYGMYNNGELVELGQTSGMSEAIREELTTNGDKYIGTVIEVEGFEQLPSGAVRHPRFIRFRDDKRPTECVWEEAE
jgi:ATP-dependent DNA ligase